MLNKKIIAFIIVLVLFVALAFLWIRFKDHKQASELVKEIKPVLGTIQNIISTTGTVLPKNRLEIKPPVNGRIEKILVKEGQKVKVGIVLAMMSSTERAALLDAARGQSQGTLKYWEEVYKAIPLISPINGEVIVATTQPGQTVTTADAIVVLSDQLIVRAQVDETDIGQIRLNQPAEVILDAYPDTKINANVEHIYYESKTVNNVTIYEVDLSPENVPPFFRSGMNSTINFIVEKKEDALVLPIEAVLKENDENYVLVKEAGSPELVKRAVVLGSSDDKNVEVISGVNTKDTVIIHTKRYILPKNDVGTNPFMPFGRKK